MPTRQKRRSTGGRRNAGGSGEGIGVDYLGGPAIDPTENVRELTEAESQRQDGLREGEAKFQNAAREAESKRQDGLRDAEVRRLADLAAQKEIYDGRIADLLRVQVENTSALLSTQLDRVTEGLGDKIDRVAASIGERVSDLEKKSWETGGKTSVTDPATAEALTRMAAAVNGLKHADSKAEGASLGRAEVLAYVVAAAVVGGFASKFLIP